MPSNFYFLLITCKSKQKISKQKQSLIILLKNAIGKDDICISKKTNFNGIFLKKHTHYLNFFFHKKLLLAF